MSDRVTISVPGSVYYDALDPLTSGMAADIGLPDPRAVRRGRGRTFVYEGVTVEQAREVASYIFDRADTQLGQDGDAEERRPYYAALRAADAIWKAVGR